LSAKADEARRDEAKTSTPNVLKAVSYVPSDEVSKISLTQATGVLERMQIKHSGTPEQIRERLYQALQFPPIPKIVLGTRLCECGILWSDATRPPPKLSCYASYCGRYKEGVWPPDLLAAGVTFSKSLSDVLEHAGSRQLGLSSVSPYIGRLETVLDKGKGKGPRADEKPVPPKTPKPVNITVAAKPAISEPEPSALEVEDWNIFVMLLNDVNLKHLFRLHLGSTHTKILEKSPEPNKVTFR